MSGTHVSWGEPFKAPLEEGFDVVAFDNRGIGLSAPVDGPFTIVEMAEDTAGLLDELGLESAHVVGISMGGMIAQELALAHPERLRSLTLGCTYCGGPGSQLMPEENLQKLVAGMASGDRDKAIRAGYEVNLSPAFRADEGRYAAFHEMATTVPAAKADDRTAGAGDLRPRHQRPARRDLDPDADRPRHRGRRPPLPQRRADRLADAGRPLRDPRGRRPHVLVGAARSAPPS